MFRITITYPSTAGAPFDWDYYMNNHLPLAVGTSMRHSGLNFSDADRPVNKETPDDAVCMVHFDSEDSMRNFCNFFIEGHPDSEKIGADEINYTTIPPGMTAGECEGSAQSGAGFRIKIFFPYNAAATFSRSDVRQIQADVLANVESVSASETDFCSSGLAADSDPDYSLIWTLNFNSREDALGLNIDLQPLTELLQAEAQIMISEVLPFDLALTAPYR